MSNVGRLLPSQLEADAVWLLATAAHTPTAHELEQLQYDLGTLSDGCKGGTSITAAQSERVLSLLLCGRARTESASSAIQHLRSLHRMCSIECVLQHLRSLLHVYNKDRKCSIECVLQHLRSLLHVFVFAMSCYVLPKCVANVLLMFF